MKISIKMVILFLILGLLIRVAFHFLKPAKTQGLYKYNNSFVGDNSAVSNILNLLEDDFTDKKIILHTKSKPYGIEINYSLPNDLKSLEKINYTILRNVSVLFALVQNADFVIVNLDTHPKKSYNISRQEVEQLFGEDFKSFTKNEQIWLENRIEAYLSQANIVDEFWKKNSQMHTRKHKG